MDRYRIELVGAASQRSAFTALGCFVEIIAYTARVFVPTDQPEVLTLVLAKWPVQSVLPKAAYIYGPTQVCGGLQVGLRSTDGCLVLKTG